MMVLELSRVLIVIRIPQKKSLQHIQLHFLVFFNRWSLLNCHGDKCRYLGQWDPKIIKGTLHNVDH